MCAQYLRVGALEAEAMSLYRHRGRELWWIFQLVDSAVERAINRIDSEIGAGHGHRVGVCMNVDSEKDQWLLIVDLSMFMDSEESALPYNSL